MANKFIEEIDKDIEKIKKLEACKSDLVKIRDFQKIDSNSIKYNNTGILSVATKFTEVNPVDQTIINTNSYLIAVDCESRLFSRLPLNGDLKQVDKWEESNNDTLMKKTIISSCSY